MKTPDGEWMIIVQGRMVFLGFEKGSQRRKVGGVHMDTDGLIHFDNIPNAPTPPNEIKIEAAALLKMMVASGLAQKVKRFLTNIELRDVAKQSRKDETL